MRIIWNFKKFVLISSVVHVWKLETTADLHLGSAAFFSFFFLSFSFKDALFSERKSPSLSLKKVFIQL